MVSDHFSATELPLVAAELPAATRLAVDLLEIIRNLRIDAWEITALLRQDPALVARIIRITNGAIHVKAEHIEALTAAALSAQASHDFR